MNVALTQDLCMSRHFNVTVVQGVDIVGSGTKVARLGGRRRMDWVEKNEDTEDAEDEAKHARK